MKTFTIIIISLLFTTWLNAEDREGDLQLPVAPLSEIQAQEERLPPTIEEVEMTRPQVEEQKEDDTKNNKKKP